ncbi:MAG: hypothetical protein ACFFCD_14185 [Promethearchaeota archaeon]
MSAAYTSNQTIALTTLFGIGMFLLTSAQTRTNFEFILFGIAALIFWILLVPYAMRIKWGYIVGIVLAVISLIAGIVVPSAPAWYTFDEPLDAFAIVVTYIVTIVNIYFSYASFKEL